MRGITAVQREDHEGSFPQGGKLVYILSLAEKCNLCVIKNTLLEKTEKLKGNSRKCLSGKQRDFDTDNHSITHPQSPPDNRKLFPQVEPYIEEWRDSCVSKEFIDANVRLLGGEEAFDSIAGTAYRLAGESANQMANSAVRRVNANNRHLYAGGWRVSGVDPLNNWEPMKWGQLKPNTPVYDELKKRYKKYESPHREGTRAFIPYVPLEVARLVLDRHNRTAGKDRQLDSDEFERAVLSGKGGFWGWLIKHPEVPLLICEGAKKVGAAFGAGYAAIGVPGVWNARKPKPRGDDGKVVAGFKDALKDELVIFAQPGRKIIFAFDADERISTQKTVWKAIAATSFLYLKDTKAKPHFTSWDAEDGKGIDDYIKANGVESFATIVAAAKSYEALKISAAIDRQLTREPDLSVCQEKLSIDFAQLPNSGIIAIVSAKGSGKTQRFLQPLAEAERSAFLIGHLINLTKANSVRMGCTYRSDLDRAAGRFINSDGEVCYKISTVIDSLMSFNPKDFKGSVIILDEICQLLRSALTSRNIGKRGNRGAILTRLRQIIQAARLILVADADLNDWALEYLEALRGDGQPAFLIENNYIPEGYRVTLFGASSPTALIAAALADYTAQLANGKDGKHIVISCDSQAKAKVIAEMARKIDGAIVLEIHSDTSGGEEEKDFIEQPDQWLDKQDRPALVIYSPSLGTGVSIENQNIGHVYGVFQGASIIDTDVLQMLGRVRTNCDRSIWIAKKGSAYSRLSHSGDPAELKKVLKDRTDTVAFSIRDELTEVAHCGLTSFDWENDPHIQAFCAIEAERNRSMPNFRARVIERLKAEGNVISSENEWEAPSMGAAMKATREQLEADEAAAIEKAEDIGETMAKLIATKESPTAEERQALTKYHLADFYISEVTAALVLADKKGERRRHVKAFEELMDKDLSISRDVAAVDRQLRWGDSLSAQDIRGGSLASETRRLIGLKDWIERTDSWASGCDELEAFKANCLQERVKNGIKLALGYTVKPKTSAQQILGDLLTQVGVKVLVKKKGTDGAVVRHYSIGPKQLSELKELVASRAAKREAPPLDVQNLKGTPPSDTQNLKGTPPYLNKKQEGVPLSQKTEQEAERETPKNEVITVAAPQLELCGVGAGHERGGREPVPIPNRYTTQNTDTRRHDYYDDRAWGWAK